MHERNMQIMTQIFSVEVYGWISPYPTYLGDPRVIDVTVSMVVMAQ